VTPGSRQSASDSSLQRGLSQSRVTLQLKQDSLDPSLKTGKLGMEWGKSVSICAKWVWWWGMDTRNINMGHSCWVGGRKQSWGSSCSYFPCSLSTVYFNFSCDVPVWPAFIRRTQAGEKVWSPTVLTVLHCRVLVLWNSSHANHIYITQPRADETMAGHPVGLNIWFNIL